jgi:hypothetical protein
LIISIETTVRRVCDWLLLYIQVEESIKGRKNTNYHSQFASPTSSAVPASASVAAPAFAAPPYLHDYRTEKVKFISYMHFSGTPLRFGSKFLVPFVVSCGYFL